MTRIMLVQPASNILKNRKEGKPSLQPLGLAYIAGTLIENGFKDVEILDVLTEGYYNETTFKKDYIRYGLSPKNIKERIKEFTPDIIGVSSICSLRQHHALEICKLAKEVNPKIVTVVGGNHFTCYPKQGLKKSYVDFVVMGEGEEPFLKIVQGVEPENIDGLAWKDDEGFHIRPQKVWRKDLDNIPFPAHHLLPLDKHLEIWNKEGYHYYPAKKFTTMIMARGCPNKCLSGDTLINTVEGNIPIKNLIKREKIGVYTYNPKNGKVFITDAIHIRKSDNNRKLLRIHFDDGTHIDCTPDHKFLTFKNGNQFIDVKEIEKEAKDLNPKDSVRAIKFYKRKDGYVDVCWKRRENMLQHRMVLEYKLGRKLNKNEIAHHTDMDKSNNNLENLSVTTQKQHFISHPEIINRMKNNNPVKYCTEQSRELVAKQNRGRKQSIEERLKHRNAMLGKKNHNYKHGKYSGFTRMKEINHKVIKIEGLQGIHDVYDLEVPETNWFFANGVLVHNCRHCPHDVLVPGYRTRSAQNIFDEVKKVHEELDVEEVQFHEYNGIVVWSIVEEFCNLMIKSGLNKKIVWGWPIGIWLKALDYDKLKLMKEAGMLYVDLAIESYDQKKLDELMKGKDVDLKHTLNVIKWCRELGYYMNCFFMLGLEGQTKKDIEKTIEFASKLDVDTIAFFIAQPLPGTPFWDECVKKKLFIKDFETFHLRYGKANIKVTGITPEELENYRHKARSDFIEYWKKRGRMPYPGKRGSNFLQGRNCSICT